MAQTIVGIFDSFADADVAKERLIQNGISRSDIQTHEDDRAGDASLAGNDARVVTSPDHTGDTGHGMMAGVERFFANMFGNDERPDEVGHYHEAVRRGGVLLSVDVRDEAQLASVRNVLESTGAVDIDSRVAHWETTGYKGYEATAKPYTPEEIDAERQAFAVVKEDLVVGKRAVETGGFRVYSRATSTPVSESVTLREEHASIERRPVDRPVTAADLREGSVEIRETAEEAVVGKTSRVVEEVVVGKTSTEHTETINETLHGTDVEVERVEGEKLRGATGVNKVDLGTSGVETAGVTTGVGLPGTTVGGTTNVGTPSALQPNPTIKPV
ncbi:YsnF/AvaK domain-containing protein [Robbsia sp. Bb-Pol-6]|uniref:YsnF/AvaK domain-containing protein n=1 Tax=Robbsia betulipollinis TaxID=2981849 RepID=A0ABT3ZTD0_9BURK|nr:YsnF/AvaK domain-containing protein [Robbsia betulipollinis]MCY0389815.1 YsnF/AvaK domain-containing protein [Robbsia betulipollinis]